MTTNDDFNNLLNDITRLNESDGHELWVLSLNRAVRFSPITVKQQKSLLTSGMTVRIKNAAFLNCVNDILVTNCREDVDLKIIDRSLLALQLRSIAVSKDLPLYIDDKEYVVDIDEHVKAIQDVVVPDSMYQFQVKTGPITITCEIPGLVNDTRMNDMLIELVGDDENIDITQSIGDIYVNELIKYIKQVNYERPGEEPDLSVNFNEDLTGKQMLRVFEQLPMSICTEITQKISVLREIEEKSLSNPSIDNKPIPVDANIFTTE
jgi:hypothetical protein